ncbi:uncharacterized protein [Hetaerina americana]|uniref:uncharacterized protein n=1 Tax=Hetaerina americana TaxID=62018 RepID=UPI003A7F108B
MKATTLWLFILGCTAVTYAGRDSSSSSSESDTSESKHSSWFGGRFRSAQCRLFPATNGTGNVHGYLHIYQKRAGEPVRIKGGLRDINGPAGTSYALAFHQGPPTAGCSGIGAAMSNVGGDIMHMVARSQHWGTGIKEQSTHISLEEGSTNSVIGNSVALREVASGKVIACCAVEKNSGRE